MSILEAFSLSGKTALVTGCKRGIGRAFAVALAEASADIIGVSQSLSEEDEVASDVRATGRSFNVYRCDFRDRDALNSFIDSAKANHPAIDILVNNAGTNRRAPTAEFPDDYWDDVINVNLNAQFFLARAFGREMVERGSGKIIFTASMLSYQGGLMVPSYAASKGAIPQLVMALSNEWASRGVQVNCIAPGYISTQMTEILRTDPVRGPQIVQRIPAGRWGEPDDLKGIVVFLASSASNYVNGAMFPVDGGWLGR